MINMVIFTKVSDLTPNQRITYAYYANNGFTHMDALRVALTNGK